MRSRDREWNRTMHSPTGLATGTRATRALAMSATTAIVGATLMFTATPASATSPPCTSQTLTANAVLMCSLPAGATMAYALKAGNGGTGGDGGDGGAGGTFDDGVGTINPGGAGGIGGTGGIGGVGAKVTGAYTNTTGADVDILLSVGLNGADGTVGAVGLAGFDSPSPGLSPGNGANGGYGTNGASGVDTGFVVFGGSSVVAAAGAGGYRGQGGQGGQGGASTGPGAAGANGSAGMPGTDGVGNTPTTASEQPFATITVSVAPPQPSAPGGSSEAAANVALPGWLTLTSTTPCTLGSQGQPDTDDWVVAEANASQWLTTDRRLGAWVVVPSQPDCRLQAEPGAELLGWATTPDFPRAIAQRQADHGWGPYEVTDADGQLTAVFIPAGWDTVISGANRLYPIWSKEQQS